MIVSKLTLLLLCSILLFSVLFANFAQQIDTTATVSADSLHHQKYNESSMIDDSPDRLMWFVQVSDLHISIFHDESRITELRQFCCETLNILKPPIVLASGDLTDAKQKNNMGSAQFRDEWLVYSDILNSCSVTNKTLWLDIRGNHDNFNVPGWMSHTNYYKHFSVQGTTTYRSYMKVIENNGEKYGFIAVDACLEPGPKRPFNFIGMLTKNDTKEIRNFVKRAKDMNVQHLIWFGHYPTSCIISMQEDSLRTIIGDEYTSKVYMCGHLHQMGGLVKEMYTIQRPGFLELELGDWKDNRMFRLAAVDHGLFSFIDVVHGKWPVVLITNPKHALYTMPLREPLLNMKQSTHVRILAFSLAPIDWVKVKFDDGNWFNCTNKKGPLFVATWNPDDYAEGMHNMHVQVSDIIGRVIIVSQPFSLDGSRMDFKTMAKIALMVNASKLFQCLFATMLVLSIVPLLTLRFIHNKIKEKKMAPVRLRKNFFHNWVKKLWFLSIVDRMFYPLMIYEIYIIFGPWLVGEIIEGHVGVVFSWGMFINGSYLPGSFTYTYGFIQMFLCQFPLTLILADNAFERYLFHWHRKARTDNIFYKVLKQLPFILIISLQMLLAYFFLLAYGTIAFLLGPFRTWSLVLNIYLWYSSLTLPPTVTRDASKVFSSWQM